MNKSRIIRNRLKVMTVVLIVMVLYLLFGLFYLTMVKGEEYRETSDTKRIKEIKLTAPRGDIYDRNGVLLAGTKPSFAVSLLKDEFNTQSSSDKNKLLMQLTSILEEDGTAYLQELPIDLHVFDYDSTALYFSNEQGPTEKVIQLIIDQGLEEDILRLQKSDEGAYRFVLANLAINIIEQKGVNVPIRTSDGGVDLIYIEGDESEAFIQKYGLAEMDPYRALASFIKGDKSALRKLLSHPMARKLTYDLLSQNGIEEDIRLKDAVVRYDHQMLLKKAELNKTYPAITEDSFAKDDFVEIVTSSSLPTLLTMLDTSEGTTVVPAKKLADLVTKKTGESLGVLIEEDVDTEKVSIQYENKDIATNELPIEKLIRKAKEADVLYEFITDQQIKYLAQEANTRGGITPEISVIEWDYIFVKNKSDMLERYDLEQTASPEELLEGMKEYYEITDADDIQALAMLSIYQLLAAQGHFGYQPINIAFGLKDETVARIEEEIENNKGVAITVEPIRFYPEGESAAHVLGYLGRISQPDEIQRYIEEKDYMPNQIIGKTGLEESFETTLKGKDGYRSVQVDSVGNRTDTLKEVEPVAGHNLTTTIDIELQKVGEEALKQTIEKLQMGGSFESSWGTAPLRGNEMEGRPYYYANAGASVVLDIKTGEVLAMINQSSYDPNLFATGISESDWKSLFPANEKDAFASRPLMNIAMQAAIQPGSIFKLNSSLAALEKGFSPYREIEDSGYIELGDTIFGCWIWNTHKGTHGYVNVMEAIRDSCNFYYYALMLGENPTSGDSLEVKLDVNDIRNMAIQLGLDKPTGVEINIPYESSGKIPDPYEKIETLKALLRNYLDAVLEDYLKPNVQLNPIAKKERIDNIVALLDNEEGYTYEELYNTLDAWKIDVDKVNEQGQTIVDHLKYTYLDRAGWDDSDSLNIVIGQGQNAYTPLQMANYTSIFANGGYKNKVTLVKNVTRSDNGSILFQNEPIREKLELNYPDSLGFIRQGMNMAAYYGSLRQVFDPLPVEVGIKTGTAETGLINPETGEVYDDYSWMIGFAPYDDPQIAVATVIFQAGSGANCAPITRELIAKYLNLSPEGAGLDETPVSEGEIIE